MMDRPFEAHLNISYIRYTDAFSPQTNDTWSAKMHPPFKNS